VVIINTICISKTSTVILAAKALINRKLYENTNALRLKTYRSLSSISLDLRFSQW
jgi:hypothetical protein